MFRCHKCLDVPVLLCLGVCCCIDMVNVQMVRCLDVSAFRSSSGRVMSFAIGAIEDDSLVMSLFSKQSLIGN